MDPSSAHDTQRPVLITAGGTGGHVFPGLAVAEALRARGVPVHWLGTRAGLEARLVPGAGIPIHWLRVSGLRGKGLVTKLLGPFTITIAVAQALWVIGRLRPQSVLGLGGFAAGPGGLAARLLGRRLVIHEQNAIAGLTNRVLARLASVVLCGFPDTFGSRVKARWAGNPVRAEIEAISAPAARLAQRSSQARMLVIGGSRGARFFNERVPAALATLAPEQRPEVRHQSGGAMLSETRARYAQLGVDAQVEPFVDDMAEAYAWADFVIARAGALTVAEIAAVGIGAILVPFPFAVDDHQTANARQLAARQAACLRQQTELDAEYFGRLIGGLVSNRAALLEMAEAARTLARPAVAEDIANVCLRSSRP